MGVTVSDTVAFIPDEVRAILRSARHVTVLTGAGTSAESGVPTFRDAQTGLWARFSPEELATPEAFRRNPKLVWDWYEWRRQLVAKARPNSGHYALARLESHVAKFVLITQNVDGLHQQAGSKCVLEVHGNIRRSRCFDDDGLVDNWELTESGLPLCPRCGGLLRPDVVWFGEPLPQSTFAEAAKASHDCDVFLSVGTSSLVYPAAGLPVDALNAGATVIEINPAETPLSSSATYSFRALSGNFLPEFIRQTWGV
jgi:NAD-dependent deacetylase